MRQLQHKHTQTLALLHTARTPRGKLLERHRQVAAAIEPPTRRAWRRPWCLRLGPRPRRPQLAAARGAAVTDAAAAAGGHAAGSAQRAASIPAPPGGAAAPDPGAGGTQRAWRPSTGICRRPLAAADGGGHWRQYPAVAAGCGTSCLQRRQRRRQRQRQRKRRQRWRGRCSTSLWRGLSC